MPQNLNEFGADLTVRQLRTVINHNPWKAAGERGLLSFPAEIPDPATGMRFIL